MPSFLLLRWAPGRTRQCFVRHLFTKRLQNTPGACKVPFPGTDPADDVVSLGASFSETRQRQDEAESGMKAA